MHPKYDDYDEALRYVTHKFEVNRIAQIIMHFDGDDSFFPLDEPMDNFPWDDIAYSMTTYPENVHLDFDKCPKCSKNRIRLKFVSYDKRAKHVEGDILVCPFCKTHFGLKELLCI